MSINKNQQGKQHRSMFILLSIISVLVISTLVVASLYFLKPGFESALKPKQTRPENAMPAQLIKEPQVKEQPAFSSDTKKSAAKNSAMSGKPNASEKDSEKDGEKDSIDNAREANNLTSQANLKQGQTKKAEPDNCNIRFFESQLLVKNTAQKNSSE